MKPLNAKTKLTDKIVRNLPYAPAGHYFYRDTLMPGLFVLVGMRTKTYTIQIDIGPRTYRRNIGEAHLMTVDEARDAARDYLKRLKAGEDPAVTKRKLEGVTLRLGWKHYESGCRERGLSEKSIAYYRDGVERVLEPWLDVSLLHLGRDPLRVKAKHAELCKTHGPYLANATFRIFRAIFNEAMTYTPELQAVGNPVKAVRFHQDQRRDTAMGKQDLAPWYKQLQALPNPIRQEFHLFTLLSGSRPEALSVAKWADIDVKRRVLHVPKPKGGAKKKFDIPLSREMIRCLVRARRAGRVMHPEQSETFIFPSDRGHLKSWNEHRSVLSKWGSDLRHTFRTLAEEAGVSVLAAHMLMNHATKGVNAGYMTAAQLTDHLRAQQQRLSTFLMRHCRGT